MSTINSEQSEGKTQGKLAAAINLQHFACVAATQYGGS